MRKVRAMEKVKVRIPDLETDEQIVAVVDELCHRLKTGVPSNEFWSAIRSSLNSHLRGFVIENELSGDPHMHASLPSDS